MDKVMKIGDLIARLQECDPEGTVTMSLDGALLYGDDEPGEIEYGFEPVIDCLFSRADAERSDRVYFLLAEGDTARIVKSRSENFGTALLPQSPIQHRDLESSRTLLLRSPSR